MESMLPQCYYLDVGLIQIVLCGRHLARKRPTDLTLASLKKGTCRSETKLPPRKRGRPRKADIEAKKSRNAVGRPPGEAARIKEFYARLLSTSGEKVIEEDGTEAE